MTGIPFGGLIGFVIGSLAGHYLWDKPREREAADAEFKNYQRKQGEFLFHVFALCAKMAKADGAINRLEIAPLTFRDESLVRLGTKVSNGKNVNTADVDGDGIARVPQVEEDGRPIDTVDRIQLGAQIVRQLADHGL